ncbi:MAG TPA: helix-turn-helix domain-containing protein [Thermoplasmata archaeon]|nr:helix-turn-helix domain-containing protein [Thermoplasmata archaeon]
MEELLSQPTRRRIYDAVGGHPGASAREVQRIVGLGWGETAYHLEQLTKGGALRRERGGRRDYYFRAEMTWDDRKLFLTLRSATARRLLLVLCESPGLTLAELRERADISLSTASFHLRYLLSQGHVEGVRDANLRRYRTVRPDRVAELLALYRDSFRDQLVERFVEAWSSLLP